MPIAFNCASCGNPLRVPDEMAGRKGKCPRCAFINVVPAASAAPQPRPAPATPVHGPPQQAGGSPFDFAGAPGGGDDGQGGDYLRRRRTGGSTALPLLIFFGMLVLIGGGLALWWFWPSGISREMKYFPDDTAVVVSFRIDQGLKS